MAAVYFLLATPRPALGRKGNGGTLAASVLNLVSILERALLKYDLRVRQRARKITVSAGGLNLFCQKGSRWNEMRRAEFSVDREQGAEDSYRSGDIPLDGSAGYPVW